MTHQIRNRIVAFTVPKPLETDEDNQDAFCFNEAQTMVAIADGASTGYRQKEWAKFLVEYFCADESSIDRIKDNYLEWLKEPQQKWRAFSSKIQSNPSIPWNQRASDKRDYAAATFVGIKIEPYDETTGQGKWHAAAVGDSCLFHISQDRSRLRVIPPTIKSYQDFNTTPSVVRSLPEKQSSPIAVYCDNSYSKTSFLQKGDFFVLATDALAKWILQSYQSSSKEWQKLLDFERQEEFSKFVTNIRSFQSNPKIDIDDTTLCVIRTGIERTITISDPAPDAWREQQPKPIWEEKRESPDNVTLTDTQTAVTSSNINTLTSNNLQTSIPDDNTKDSKANSNINSNQVNMSTDRFKLNLDSRRFLVLATIGTLCLIPSILNLLINLVIVGWISPILGISKPNSSNTSQNPPINNKEITETPKNRVTSIEGIPLYKPDANFSSANNPQPVGFLFSSVNSSDIQRESEVEVFIHTQFDYMITDSTSGVTSLKNNQLLPICKTNPNPPTKEILGICKDNIGYILPNSSLIVDSPNDSPTIYKNGRVVKAKLKIQK